MKRILLIALVALAAALTVATPPAQAGLSPCARAVINDWYDGRIDKQHKPRCYREAIRFARANPDIRTYTSLEEDLLRALRRPLRNGLVPAGALGRRAARLARQRQIEQQRRIQELIDADPSSQGAAETSDEGASAPLPLIILGGAGILLLGLGLASYARRWFGGSGGGEPPAAQA